MAGFINLPLVPPVNLVCGSNESIHLDVDFRCPEPWDLPMGLGSFTNGYLRIQESQETNQPSTEGRNRVVGRCFAVDAERVEKYQGPILGLFWFYPEESKFRSRGELVIPSRQFRGLLESSLRGICPNNVRLDFLFFDPIKSGEEDPFFVVIDAIFTTTLVFAA